MRSCWISELALLEILVHPNLTPRHGLPEEIREQVLQDRIWACEGALGEATTGINIVYGKEFEKCCTYLDKFNKNSLQIKIC